MRALVLTAQLSYIYNGLLALIYKKVIVCSRFFFLVSHKFSDLLEFREVERCREHALSLVVSLLNELAFSYVTFKAYCWCQETVCLHMLLVLAFCDELMLHPVVY